MESVIPTIDLARDSPAQQAELIKDALGSVGFFAVQGSSIATEDINEMFSSVRTLVTL